MDIGLNRATVRFPSRRRIGLNNDDEILARQASGGKWDEIILQRNDVEEAVAYVSDLGNCDDWDLGETLLLLVGEAWRGWAVFTAHHLQVLPGVGNNTFDCRLCHDEPFA